MTEYSKTASDTELVLPRGTEFKVQGVGFDMQGDLTVDLRVTEGGNDNGNQ